MSTNNAPDFTFGSYNSAFLTNDYVFFPTSQGSVNFSNTLFSNNVNTFTDVDVYTKQTTGKLNIAGNTSRTGSINIGNQSTVSNAINIGSNLSTLTIVKNSTISATSISGTSITLGSGGTIRGNNITNASPYYSLYITCGDVNPAFILDSLSGELTLGGASTTNVLITPPLSAQSYGYVSPPTTLLKTK